MSEHEGTEDGRQSHVPPAPGPSGDSDPPMLYALTRQAGGYKLRRRDFLNAAATAAVASAAAAASRRVAQEERHAGARPPGNRLWLNDKTGLAAPKAHQGTISSLAFHPDGRFLASGGWDESVKLWSMPEGSLHATLQGYGYVITTVAFSPDGTLLATGGEGTGVHLWSVPEQKRLVLLPHAEHVTAVDFSPAGGLLASRSEDKALRLWSVPQGQLQATLEDRRGGINAVAFSPDGRLLAAGNTDGTVKLWSAPFLTNAKPRQILAGHKGRVTAVVFSPEGKFLASGSSDKTIKVWSLPEGTLYKTLDAHDNVVCTIAWSPDGQRLASGSRDGTVKLWSMPDGELQATLEGHRRLGAKEPPTTVTAVAFSPDGKVLASADDRGILLLWELDGEKKRWALFDPDVIQTQMKLRSVRQGRPVEVAPRSPGAATCLCNTIWVPVSWDVPPQTVCVCDAIIVGAPKVDADSKSEYATVSQETVCLCDQICTCHVICTCNTVARPSASQEGQRPTKPPCPRHMPVLIPPCPLFGPRWVPPCSCIMVTTYSPGRTYSYTISYWYPN